MPARIKYPVVDGNKQCGTCLLWKPVSAFKKARTHYSASCTDCRKKYEAEYRARPEVVATSQEYHKAYMRIKENRDRANARGRRHMKKPEAKVKKNLARRLWAAAEKQKAVDYKGGKCVCCGYSGCLAAMDFHHRDPTEKDGYGSGALRSHRTFEQNIKEIDKCELVCVRCHREIHAGYRTL